MQIYIFFGPLAYLYLTRWHVQCTLHADVKHAWVSYNQITFFFFAMPTSRTFKSDRIINLLIAVAVTEEEEGDFEKGEKQQENHGDRFEAHSGAFSNNTRTRPDLIWTTGLKLISHVFFGTASTNIFVIICMTESAQKMTRSVFEMGGNLVEALHNYLCCGKQTKRVRTDAPKRTLRSWRKLNRFECFCVEGFLCMVNLA